MTRVLAKELARRRITVNAVAPGVIQTPMLGEIKPEVMAEYLKQIPARPARQAGRHRQRRAVPGERGERLHHRAGAAGDGRVGVGTER